jgi:hypothetical protein
MSNLNIILYFITFTATFVCVSGVYFLLTLITDAKITAYLVTLHSLFIVISNINVRF